MNTVPGKQGHRVFLGMKVGYVFGIILIQFYPINRELHRKMCREIEDRRVTGKQVLELTVQV